MKFIVQNKTLLTYGLTLVNLVAIVLFSLLGTNASINKIPSKSGIFNTISIMDKISQDLIFSEAHVNNFILTSEPSYVEKYRSFRKPLQSNLNSLEDVFNESSSISNNKFIKLKQLINKKIFELESSILLKKQNGLLSASEYLQVKKSEKCMEQIKSIQEELLKEQKSLLQVQQSKLEFSIKSREYIVVSASIASLLISIIAIGTIVADLNEKREREKYLESINENKDKFFTLISHDLKGPAQNLIGISDILLHDESLTEEENKTFLGHLNETAKKNFTLLENLLEWSRVQMGSIVLNPTKLNLWEITQESVLLSDEKAFEKNITIKNEIPEDLKVYADFNSIKTVIRNIITNALKFTKPGGEIVISAFDYRSEATISISDNGIGMTQEVKRNLFNPGKVVSRYGTEGETGSGIGLLLCKEFINKNSGSVWVESEENKGTSFFFTLPLYTNTSK